MLNPATEVTPLTSSCAKGGADASLGTSLDGGEPINIYEWRRLGYLGQYFAVGLLYAALPSTNYAVFVCYLNVPAYVSAAAASLTTLPWSFKILFAMLSDGVPICGYRRRPYMVAHAPSGRLRVRGRSRSPRAQPQPSRSASPRWRAGR